jgi:tRNA threonylcarbamoyladenosine biosynthesis protein TsaE
VAGKHRQLSAADETAMLQLGARLSRALKPGMIVFLEGDLGMGKTTLARGIVQSLGHSGAVKSPTYTLVEPYEMSDLTLYHFDLYRLGDAEELEFMGIRDYFGPHSIALVEWSGRGEGVLPPPDLVVTIEPQGTGRTLAFEAHSKRGVECLKCLSEEPGITT